METQHSSPGSMVCADAGVEVTKDIQLIRFRHSGQEGVQVPVAFVPYSVMAGHRDGGVDGDDAGEVGFPKRQAEAHQAIVVTLRQIGQSSHDVVPDGKGDARVSSLRLGAATPEECAASSNLQFSQTAAELYYVPRLLFSG
ncbi:hypothetical protein SprV_0401549000 [Sparganum proliferum]